MADPITQLPNSQLYSDVSTDLDVQQIVDPGALATFTAHIADTMNSQSSPRFEDLQERVADIIIETSAQGASLLEVHLIDPQFWLLQSGFIGITEDGFLWPPIEVAFPPDQPDRRWRLAQMRASKVEPDTTEANLILTFEDKAVAQMREVGPQTNAQTKAIAQSAGGDTVASYVKKIVDAVNGAVSGQIKYVPLIDPTDPNATAPIGTTTPTPTRPNPTKAPGAPTRSQQDQINAYNAQMQRLFPEEGTVAATTIAALEAISPPPPSGIAPPPPGPPDSPGNVPGTTSG